jgi:hypothetical protein
MSWGWSARSWCTLRDGRGRWCWMLVLDGQGGIWMRGRVRCGVSVLGGRGINHRCNNGSVAARHHVSRTVNCPVSRNTLRPVSTLVAVCIYHKSAGPSIIARFASARDMIQYMRVQTLKRTLPAQTIYIMKLHQNCHFINDIYSAETLSVTTRKP